MPEATSNLVPGSMGRRLEGKVSLITGGASGAGESTARLFCQHGAKVVIVDIQDDLGRSVAASVGSDDIITYVHCDVSKEDDVRNVVDLAVAKYGKLDIIFNNAAIVDPSCPKITDVDASAFERVLSVNVTGVFLGTKHAARVMGPGSSIINTSSVVSVIGGGASHAYVASKHAVVGLTKNAAAELGGRGIRVNCISPYAFATPLTCGFYDKDGKSVEEWAHRVGNLKGAVLRAEDVAQAVLFFGSDESKYVSGHNFVIDGGFSVVNSAFSAFDQQA